MIRKYDIVKLLREVIANLEITVKVKSSVDNGDGTFTIESCNTQYLNDCTVFTLNGIDYMVISIENDKSVTLQGSPQITETFNLKAPLFIPDTPRGVNNETTLLDSDVDRHPFIWLLENFPTTFDNTGKDRVSEARVRLFFLNSSQDGTWLEEEHRTNCIEPMQNLCDVLIENIKDKISGKIDTYTVYNRIRFGNSAKNKSILNEQLSGVELDVTIPVKSWAVKCEEC